MLSVCATTNTTAATATTIAPRLLLISTNPARAPRARSYIVALRNLNAVVSFAKDGSGIQWLLAADANLTSKKAANASFAFDGGASRFYDPHTAIMLDDGNLLLMDDGNNRAGCADDSVRTNHSGSEKHCFSRAVKYELSYRRREATLAWQFEFPNLWSSALSDATDEAAAIDKLEKADLFEKDGGSAYYLADAGDYLVGFTATDENDADFKKQAYLFEIDADGGVVAEMTFRRQLWDLYQAGMYRMVPYDTIYGESKTCPFTGQTER